MEKIYFEIFEQLGQLNRTGRYTTFWSFSGHINVISIQIYSGAWTDKKKPIFEIQQITVGASYYYDGCVRCHFDPQTFRKYLADLLVFRSRKGQSYPNYSDYDK